MNNKPPKLFDRLLDWYCRQEGLEDLQGDIYEVFFDRSNSSRLRANVLFSFDVLNLLNPFSSQRRRSFWNNNPSWLYLVWNYLTIGLRNLRKNKIYVLINAFGVSLACCIATYLWIAYDSEFDDFHRDEKVSNIYKLHSYWDGSYPGQNILAPFPLAPLAAQEIEGIERFTRYYYESGFVHFEKKGFTAGLAFADSTFFEMFDFPGLKGDLRAFKKEQFIVVSKALAEKLFGGNNPIGKTITLKLSHSDPIQLFVGAVIDKIPHNSSFTFECMIRVEMLQKVKKEGFTKNDWGPWPAYSTFFELSSDEHLEKANKQFQKYIELCQGRRTKFQLEHFKADFTMTEILGAMINVRMYPMPLRILIGLTALIFMIACFNLANTSFALIAGRLKEIGIRKTLGATKSQIFAQFLVETCVIVTLSLLIGLSIAQYIVPAFADMWADGIGNRWSTLIFRMEDVGGLNPFIALILIAFACVAIAGIYPAIISSKYDPVHLLKGSQRVFGTNGVTRFLLVVQFSISILVLTSGIIFIKNSSYIATKDLGFDSDRLIIRFEDVKKFDALSNSIKQIAGVSKVAASRDHLGIRFRREEVDVDGKMIKSKLIFTGSDYFETMGFGLMKGRFLDESDIDKSVVVTKEFTQQSRLENPIGSRLVWREKGYTIVGVIDNVIEGWYLVSVREKPQIFFRAEKEKNNKFLIVRTEEQNTQEVYRKILTSWDELYPLNPINANIHIRQIQDGPLDTAEDLRNVFVFLTIMTVLLSLTGVYSLAALNVEKRKSEIGIRKALGASISHLTQLLNKEFLLILGCAAVIGSTSCFLIFHEIITVREYKIIFSEIGLEPFVTAPVLLIIIGALTSGGLIFKAASANPTSILRTE